MLTQNSVEFPSVQLFFVGLLFCWGWVFDRVAKWSDNEPRHYKVKESEQGPEADQWQQDMATVVASHQA